MAYADMDVGPGHRFDVRLNEVLDGEELDAFVKTLCARFYAERGIGWRWKDSLSLRRLLGIALEEDRENRRLSMEIVNGCDASMARSC